MCILSGIIKINIKVLIKNHKITNNTCNIISEKQCQFSNFETFLTKVCHVASPNVCCFLESYSHLRKLIKTSEVNMLRYDSLYNVPLYIFSK